MQKLNRHFFHFLSMTLLWLLLSCAMQKAPGGGPVDRTPPEVVFTNPPKDSLHIAAGLKQFEIRFSERMARGSLRGNIFISPPIQFETHWKGWERLFLDLQEPLQKEQTYVVSIGSEAKDLHNNTMKGSYTFAFSTGSVIDQGRISGRVYGQKQEAVHIFAFLLNDSLGFAPTSKRPSYISKSGRDGTYELNYLKLGHYRLLAVSDQNHNLKLDADFERVGIPYRDVRLDSAALFSDFVDFRMTHVDTVAPRLAGMRAVNRRHFQARYSEPLTLSDTKFILLDSLAGDTIPLLGIGKNKATPNVLDVFTADLDSGHTYLWQSEVLADTVGNINDSLNSASFKMTAPADTTAFRLLEFLPKDSSRSVPADQKITVTFSLPVKWPTLARSFVLQTTANDTLAGHWLPLDPFSAGFTAAKGLRPDSAYRAVLRLGGVQDLWGATAKDTLLQRYFTIVSARQLGEISGKVVLDPDSGQTVKLRVRSLEKKIKPRVVTVKKNRKFYFQFLPEGKYLLDGYIDLDKNNKYSAGQLFPFHLSEPFFFATDTIKVRKRWEKSGILFKFPATGKRP